MKKVEKEEKVSKGDNLLDMLGEYESDEDEV